jgi:quercetin dioxygenase-like cupin family protein
MGDNRSIIETDRVRVRIMGLAAGEELPYHYHSEVTDNFFCLKGEIVVTAREPEQAWQLGPGEHCEVTAPRPHSVRNPSPDTPASYLLVQGVGTYDFIPVTDSEGY